ncbi:hypothetical protein BK708_25305 [Bacillus thuringiensis serovar yunnanensis]|nr:hypothetical protein BK708_25305 [Bacillus thuringiensis serovar yunnanensis]
MITNISKIDPTILEKLVEKGMHIKLVDYPITETNEYADLKDRIPWGWAGVKDSNGNQLTWNDVPGIGSVDGKPVVARIGYSEPGKGHNTINLELHETAHAIDRVVFHDISKTDGFRKAGESEQKNFLPGHYTENPVEYFAESLAYYYKDAATRQVLKDKAPMTYSYIESLIDTLRKNPNYFDHTTP